MELKQDLKASVSNLLKNEGVVLRSEGNYNFYLHRTTTLENAKAGQPLSSDKERFSWSTVFLVHEAH
jgi:hypothetical protein